MKVIRRGQVPEERVYRVICNRCKTEIEFEQREATYHPDQRDGDFLSITCPVCMSQITKAA